MFRKILILLIFISSYNSYANNTEDLVADKENLFEIDADFPDDFEAIEKPSGRSLEGFLLEPHDAFKERGFKRDERSLGVALGSETIARTFYLSFNPEVRFSVWKFHNHLGLPLRFPVYDNVDKNRSFGRRVRGFVNGETFITPRTQDFRNFTDAQRLIRRIEVGTKDDPYFFELGRDQALTLAHGDLMKEMTSDGLYDQDYLFFSGHASFEPVRIDAMTGPLPLISMLGLNTRFMPLASLNIPSFVKNTNADVSYIADYRAPQDNKRLDDVFLLDDDRRLLKRSEGTAQGVSLGLASEFFPVPQFATKPYTSYSHLFLIGLERDGEKLGWSYGGSLNLGHDATFFPIASNKHHIILLRTEARFFSEKYAPNYFGDKYMLDRVNFNEEMGLTKAQVVAFPKDKGFRFGHLVELGYALDNIFNIKLGYENAHLLKGGKSIKPLRKIHFNTGLFVLDTLRLQMGYEVSSLDQLGDLFNFEKNRTLISLNGQFKAMSFLYLDAWLKHSFGINDKYQGASLDENLERVWVSSRNETRSLNFGLGVTLAMVF